MVVDEEAGEHIGIKGDHFFFLSHRSRIAASIPLSMSSMVFAGPVYPALPNTSSMRVTGQGLTGLSNTPSAVSSTMRVVPGFHFFALRIALGKTICPLLESLVVAML